jgi:hypothetical protein
MIQRLADEHRLDIRKWSAVSHVVALMYRQLAGCDSLNGIVDAARVHEGESRNIRGAEPPKRNTFSNANRHRCADMAERLYVVRQKKNMRLMCVKRLGKGSDASIISDELVEPVIARTKELDPVPLRRVAARVEADGRTMEMVFLTNNLDWSARTIAELYKTRWSIELFFKELKQTCLILKLRKIGREGECEQPSLCRELRRELCRTSYSRAV